MKHFSHLNTAVQLLKDYRGNLPFGIYSKQFFSQHKKYGSRDRKSISHLCYACFRLGKALPELPVEEKILVGLFLATGEPGELLQQVKPMWYQHSHEPLARKIALLNAEGLAIQLYDIFPWTLELSAGLDAAAFCASFFVQPNLFLRLRPGKEALVKNKLAQAGIPYSELNTACLALPNSSRLNELIAIDQEAVIQDYSSQRIREFLAIIPTTLLQPGPLKVWDCCAASGGKSILVKDVLGNIALTVSDVRASILHNLSSRFAVAGIKQYQSFVADLSNTNTPPAIPGAPYNLVIADVPCSGAGTWGRTPEQLYFFDHAAIDRYSHLQKSIVRNVLAGIQPGGYLLYITCSVFKKENEEVVEFIQANSSLTLQKMELLTGYNEQADTLFAALFTA